MQGMKDYESLTGTSGTQNHYIGDSIDFLNLFVGELRTENRHIEDLKM